MLWWQPCVLLKVTFSGGEQGGFKSPALGDTVQCPVGLPTLTVRQLCYLFPTDS